MWQVLFHPELEAELEDLPREAATKLAEILLVLRQLGPQLGRPLVDTLKGSRYDNLKELRFSAGGVWRFVFAFDPKRRAIVLAAVDKRSGNQQRAYGRLIAQLRNAGMRTIWHRCEKVRVNEAQERLFDA